MDHSQGCLIVRVLTLGIIWMPHKFNRARRHKFDKARYQVINWTEYDESLR